MLEHLIGRDSAHSPLHAVPLYRILHIHGNRLLIIMGTKERKAARANDESHVYAWSECCPFGSAVI